MNTRKVTPMTPVSENHPNSTAGETVSGRAVIGVTSPSIPPPTDTPPVDSCGSPPVASPQSQPQSQWLGTMKGAHEHGT